MRAKKNEMGGARGTYGRDESWVGFWREHLNNRDHLKYLGIDGGDNIRMHLKEIRWEEKDWIDLAQNRNKWLAIVKRVMNIWVP